MLEEGSRDPRHVGHKPGCVSMASRIGLWDPKEWPTRLLCPWHFPGKNTDWSGLPVPSSGDLPDPGIEPMSPALAGGFSTTVPPVCTHAYGRCGMHQKLKPFLVPHRIMN